MEMEWSEVKKITLWNHEEIIEKMQTVLSYKFVKEQYNHSMAEAADYVDRLLGYDPKYANKVNMLKEFFKNLDSVKVKNYADLLHQIEDKEKCEKFLKKTKLPFRELILALNYIFRWVLPFKLYLRELIDTDDETQKKHLGKLRKFNIKFNLDLLEAGKTKEGRRKISKETGIPETFINELVNRADMTRLPYSNRKTVKYLFAAGYSSVDKIAQTNLKQLTENMQAYFERIGIRLSRSFIDVNGISTWAKAIPKIVQTV